MDLPPELKQSIAAYLDDKSVLNIRLIDKKWFNSIKNIHFPVYMPRADTLPLIVKSLSLYNTPISLTIHKPIRIPLRNFIEQVATLSNLTSLTFPYFSDFEYQRDQPEWHLLTSLTRLRSIILLNPNRIQERDQLSAPEGFLRALVHLPHLATLQLSNCNYAREELDKCVTLLKKLEDASFQNLPSLDLLPLMSSRLTRLCISEPSKIPVAVNEINVFQNLKMLRLSGLQVSHLCLTEITSLVTLGVFAKRVTGLDNNTNLKHLTIQSYDPAYDQIRKLPNLERLTIWTKEENKDPYFYNDFTKLTYLCMVMRFNYDVRNISRSVKTLELEINQNNFNYASLAVLTSLDSLIVTTWDLQTEKRNHLAEISALTGLTRLIVETEDDLTLANLSTLTNLERLHTRSGNSCLSLELSFLSHLTKLRALSNTRLRKEHYSEIARLTQLTYLACLNASEQRGNYGLLSHLPLKVLVAEVLQDDLNSFLQAVSAMTTLELLGIFEEAHRYDVDTVKHADWSLLSSLTRLTRLDLDLSGATSDTLTSLTRVTSLQYLNVKPKHEIVAASSLDDWLPFSTQFPNLVSVSYVYSSVYSDPFIFGDFDPN